MKQICVMTAIVLAAAAASAHAAPIGPTYPAPGGNNFTPGAINASAGVSDRLYDNFNSSAWSELYFGFTDVKGPLADNLSQTLTFTGFDVATQSFVWTSSTPWTFTAIVGTGSVFESTPVQFHASFWDVADSVSINSAVINPAATVGIAGAPIVLAMDAATLASWGGGFRVHASFTTPTGMSIDSFYNQPGFSHPCTATSSTCVQSGTTGAFYSIAPVPEPGSLLLLGTGLLGIGRGVRSRFLA